MHIMLIDTHAQPHTRKPSHICVLLCMSCRTTHAHKDAVSLSLSLPLNMTQKAIMLSVSFLKQFQHIAADAHTHNHMSSWLKQDKHESSGRNHNSQPVMCVDVAIIVVPQLVILLNVTRNIPSRRGTSHTHTACCIYNRDCKRLHIVVVVSVCVCVYSGNNCSLMIVRFSRAASWL